MNLSCDTISIYLFDKISQTGDFTLLEVENPKEVWMDILVEYESKMNDYEQKVRYRKQLEILYLETKINVLKQLFLVKQTGCSYEELKRIDKIALSYDVRNLERGIKSTVALLKIKKKELTSSGKRKSLDYNIARVSSYLGYRIDKFQTTVSEWIEILKMVEEQVKERKNVAKN